MPDASRIDLIPLKKSELDGALLIIFHDLQSKGSGSQAMATVHALAAERGLKVTLSSFKNNTRAIEFYQKLGYRISNQDGPFYDLVLDRP